MTQWHIPILMYHQVYRTFQDGDQLSLGVPVDHFERQMKFLKSRGYQSISLDETVNAIKHGDTIPGKSVVITFDDGYEDTYLNAFPILRHYGFSATIFLVSSLIGGSNEWDVEKGYPEVPLLSLDEIYEMKEQGITFGSHSATHTPLTTLNKLQLEQEIRASKLYLEKLLGFEIKFFCYPHYRTNEFIERLVQEAGYIGACGGPTLDYHPYNLPRIEIARSNRLHFWWKVSGWYYRVRRNQVLRTIKARVAPITRRKGE